MVPIYQGEIMFYLILLVITTNGTTMDNVIFDNNNACLEAMNKVLDFEKNPNVRVIKAQCVYRG
jgi:hypothetical protein